MVDLKLMSTLKKKAQEEKLLIKIWEYYLDHFGEQPGFIELGHPYRDDLLMQIIEKSASPVLGKTIRVQRFDMIELPEHQFVHGAGILNGYLSNILYWRDLHMGVLCIVGVKDPFDTQLVRFRAQPLPAGWSPQAN